ncbi:MAG: hypothetical protein FWD43_03290 [Coriobacteriia bacterium]|nr:hypothetical protein [Coriobacteriia bacterium]
MEFTLEQARDVAVQLGIDFSTKGYTLEEFAFGMNVELEHGTADPFTNVTNDDPIVTGKIALAHLNEVPMYYNEKIGLEVWEHLLEHLPADAPRNGIEIV